MVFSIARSLVAGGNPWPLGRTGHRVVDKSLRLVRHAMAGLCGVLALPQIYANHPLEYAAHAFFTKTALRPISVRYNPNQYDLEGTA
jgi:hypothetical protein